MKWGKVKKDMPPIVWLVLAAIMAIVLTALLRAIGSGGFCAL